MLFLLVSFGIPPENLFAKLQFSKTQTLCGNHTYNVNGVGKIYRKSGRQNGAFNRSYRGGKFRAGNYKSSWRALRISINWGRRYLYLCFLYVQSVDFTRKKAVSLYVLLSRQKLYKKYSCMNANWSSKMSSGSGITFALIVQHPKWLKLGPIEFPIGLLSLWNVCQPRSSDVKGVT